MRATDRTRIPKEKRAKFKRTNPEFEHIAHPSLPAEFDPHWSFFFCLPLGRQVNDKQNPDRLISILLDHCLDPSANRKLWLKFVTRVSLRCIGLATLVSKGSQSVRSPTASFNPSGLQPLQTPRFTVLFSRAVSGPLLLLAEGESFNIRFRRRGSFWMGLYLNERPCQ